MHVEVVLLGEGVAAYVANKGTLISVNGFDVHLQAISTGSSMAALLAHKRLLATMLGRVVDPQLGPG